MAKYDKKSALQIIVNAAKKYDVKLNNKHFLIVYQRCGRTETVYVGFRDMNFLHMTGVRTFGRYEKADTSIGYMDIDKVCKLCNNE